MKKLKIIIPLVRAGGGRRHVQDGAGAQAARAEGPRRGVRAAEGVRAQPQGRPLREAGRRAWWSSTATRRSSPRAVTPPRRPRATAATAQEAIVRDIVTDHLTDAPAEELIEPQGPPSHQGGDRQGSAEADRCEGGARALHRRGGAVMDEIEYTQLDASARLAGTDAGLDRLRDVPVDLVVEIGRTRMTIGEALKLSPGSVIGLNRLAGDPVNLLVNGKPIARGEVVVVDEEFGLRVTEVVSEGGALNGTRPSGLEAAPAPRAARSCRTGARGRRPPSRRLERSDRFSAPAALPLLARAARIPSAGPKRRAGLPITGATPPRGSPPMLRFRVIIYAIAAAFLAAPARVLAATPSEKDTPLNLGGGDDKTSDAASHTAGGGSIVRTLIGLAIVVGIIFALHWILKQAKASKEGKASGARARAGRDAADRQRAQRPAAARRHGARARRRGGAGRDADPPLQRGRGARARAAARRGRRGRRPASAAATSGRARARAGRAWSTCCASGRCCDERHGDRRRQRPADPAAGHRHHAAAGAAVHDHRLHAHPDRARLHPHRAGHADRAAQPGAGRDRGLPDDLHDGADLQGDQDGRLRPAVEGQDHRDPGAQARREADPRLHVQADRRRRARACSSSSPTSSGPRRAPTCRPTS